MKKMFLIIILFTLLFVTGCGKKDGMAGEWRAPKEYQTVYRIDKDTTGGGKNDYSLKCNGKGKCTIKLDDGKKHKWTYELGDKKVTFFEDDKRLGDCIYSEKLLTCDSYTMYSTKYIKK